MVAVVVQCGCVGVSACACQRVEMWVGCVLVGELLKRLQKIIAVSKMITSEPFRDAALRARFDISKGC